MTSTRPEIAFGRLLARCAHPYATWRTQPRVARIAVWITYFAAAYTLVLGALALALSR